MEVLIGKSPINGPLSIELFDYRKVYSLMISDSFSWDMAASSLVPVAKIARALGNMMPCLITGGCPLVWKSQLLMGKLTKNDNIQ